MKAFEKLPILSDTGEINAALRDFDSFQQEIAHQRLRLRQLWKDETAKVIQVEERRQALETTLSRRASALSALLQRSEAFRYAPLPMPSDGMDPRSILVRNNRGAWVVNESIEAQLESAFRNAHFEISQAGKKSQLHRTRATELLNAYSHILAMIDGVLELVEQEHAEAIEARVQAVDGARSDFDTALAIESARTRTLQLRLPPSMQPWSSGIWETDWTQFSTIDWPSQMFFGTLTPTPDPDLHENSDFGVKEAIPLVVNWSGNLQLLYDSSNRDETMDLVRSLLLRSLVAVQPGGLNLCFVDPEGLGEALGGLLELGDFDPALISGKVWSSQSEISDRLAEQTERAESIEEKYLRSTTYSSIYQFNLAAGKMAETYRLMVFLDFPIGFNQELYAALGRVLEAGPRCGIRTLLVSNLEAPMPFGVGISKPANRIHRIVMSEPFSLDHEGYSLEMHFRPDSERAMKKGLTSDIIDRVGGAAAARDEGLGEAISRGVLSARRDGLSTAGG